MRKGGGVGSLFHLLSLTILLCAPSFGSCLVLYSVLKLAKGGSAVRGLHIVYSHILELLREFEILLIHASRVS